MDISRLDIYKNTINVDIGYEYHPIHWGEIGNGAIVAKQAHRHAPVIIALSKGAGYIANKKLARMIKRNAKRRFFKPDTTPLPVELASSLDEEAIKKHFV